MGHPAGCCRANFLRIDRCVDGGFDESELVVDGDDGGLRWRIGAGYPDGDGA